MSDIKTILVAVSDGVSGQPALDLALLVGREIGTHVKALHVKTDPSNAVPLVGEGMSGVMVEEMISAAERQADERAQAAKAMFEARRQAFGVALAGAPGSSGFQVTWREQTGREEDVVARCARLNDLTVLGRPQADAELPSMMTLNAVLMESGRPLLVAPPQAPAELSRQVAIAWNGSAEAARAVSAAMPFLRRAESVTVLSAQEQDSDQMLGTAEMCNYLAWHGITAAARTFKSGVTNTGEMLGEQVKECGAGLLVMGAYTHSRLRQLILGGVTRHMLYHASIPVLMMH